MSGIVTLEATLGELKGKTFEYTENTPRLYMGRNEDCGIVVPERTASRYHCVLEIQPPKARLQDFGSLNGTYLNGELIGKRDPSQRAEQGQAEEHGLYTLKDGDTLSLGRSSAFVVHIKAPLICDRCGDELPLEVSEKDCHRNDEGDILCETCYAAYLESQKASEGKKRCAQCGKAFTPVSEDNKLCPDCLAARGKIIDDALEFLKLQFPQVVRKPESSGTPSLLPGYDLIGTLGKGGMGEVMRVRQVSSGKEFALKTIRGDGFIDERKNRQFLREANVSKFLRNEHVVRSYEVGSVKDTLYILMEICEGGSAYALMRQSGGRLSQELATYITLQMLSGLDYVHNADVSVHIDDSDGGYDMECKGIVHRDLKPDNIFLSDHGAYPVAKIADFGLAKAMDSAGLSDISKTGADLGGTVAYMCREQALNCKYSKCEVDVWSAAASYYHMLTGDVPKDFNGGKHPLCVVVTESARPIRKLNRRIDSRMAEVIDYALVEQPRIGFQSAAEFRAALVEALPGNIKDYCEGILYE